MLDPDPCPDSMNPDPHLGKSDSPDNISDSLEGAAAQVEDLKDPLLYCRGAAAADLQDNVVDELQLEETSLQPK
jgi:hypothetical protein